MSFPNRDRRWYLDETVKDRGRGLRNASCSPVGERLGAACGNGAATLADLACSPRTMPTSPDLVRKAVSLAALYADAHPERVGRIVFLDPMWPANKPYERQRSERIESLIAPKDAARLKEIENEWETASDDQMRAMCMERFRILLGPYLFNPSSYDASRPEATIVGREIAGICSVPPAAIRNLDHVADAAMSSLGDFDFRPMLAKLKVPVLVVEGEKSNVPLDATREWVKAVPGARLLLIPGAGHMALEEKPEAVHEIGAFLSGQWPPTANEIRGSK